MSSGNYSVAGNLTVSGNVILGGSLLTQPFTVGSFGNVLIQGGADSTNLFTGALQIIGGAALTANCYVGGNIRTTNTMAATSAVTGAIICGGGVGIGGNVFAGGNVVTTNTAHATSAVTGAIICGGGVGIGGNVFAGGNATVNGNVVTTNTTHATSAITGAIVCGGGIGVTGNVYTGGNIRITNSTASTSTSTGALIVTGGAGIAGSVSTAGVNLTGGAWTGFSTTTLYAYQEYSFAYTIPGIGGGASTTFNVLFTRLNKVVHFIPQQSLTVICGGSATTNSYMTTSNNPSVSWVIPYLNPQSNSYFVTIPCAIAENVSYGGYFVMNNNAIISGPFLYGSSNSKSITPSVGGSGACFVGTQFACNLSGICYNSL